MKYLTILALLFIINLKAQNFQLLQNEKVINDQLHIGATYIISSVTTSYVFKKTQNKKKAMWIGFGVGMGVGIAKEIYDIEHGDCEAGDLLADFIGSSLGCLVITIPLP